MIQINQLKLPPKYGMEDILHKVCKLLCIQETEVASIERVRESIDARKRQDVCYRLSVRVSLKREREVMAAYRKKHPKDKDVFFSAEKPYVFPQCGKKPLGQRPIIVGTGPAGLFCGYFLAARGFRPILLERGSAVEKRRADVEKYWERGILDTESNVQFGEGGAGTFSDGKLNTLTKDKSGRNKEVLRVFVQMGAPPSILYEQKPHLGTDVLYGLVKNFRQEIIRLGGEIYFDKKVDELLLEKDCFKGVRLSDGTAVAGNICILATGHSARDTFQMLYEKGVFMESKSFAVGFRMQHPQEMIDRMQYGGAEKQFPTASYKVTAKTSGGRGVYSFCMCPGGYVVNASSEEGMLAVNGMSYQGRDGKNANSAIIVSVTPEDYPGKGPLSGIAFQRIIEKRAYEAAEGKIPVQLYGDFVENQKSVKCGGIGVEVKGQYAFSNLRHILPEELNEAFMEGMEQFGRKIKGFDRKDTVMAGVEARTSSPVRIVRDGQLMSNIRGVYPCGEGAGYAGGITSAAADGIYVAEQIVKTYFPDFGNFQEA